ncbi:unnamed protein product [Rangifer tarandus platyrhynchus]|uniref:Uncharacterized protein n=1 Tax=Rangifer tarandus platyrhynchus TaxID=3082113 RepID=A0AC59YFW6_RANTA
MPKDASHAGLKGKHAEAAGRIQESRVIEPAPEAALAGNVRQNRAALGPFWASLLCPAHQCPYVICR